MLGKMNLIVNPKIELSNSELIKLSSLADWVKIKKEATFFIDQKDNYLYNWNAINQINAKGFKVPSQKEFEILLKSDVMNQLILETDYLLPDTNDEVKSYTNGSFFWTSDELDEDKAICLYINYENQYSFIPVNKKYNFSMVFIES